MIKKSFGASLLIADTTLYEVPAGKKLNGCCCTLQTLVEVQQILVLIFTMRQRQPLCPSFLNIN